jgi:predicted nucleic acid-binding protein
MILLDTDILIDHFHGHQAALDFMAGQFSAGETVAISVITVTEFTGGMRPDEAERTRQLLSLFTVLPVDQAVAHQAGAYLRTYRRSHRLELGDALIGATARQHQATLYTRNLKHYPMDDLTVTAPYQRGEAR